MTLTTNKAAARATTAAAAMNDYIDEITEPAIEVDWAAIEAEEMATAEAMDAALAAFFEQEMEFLMKTSGLS